VHHLASDTPSYSATFTAHRAADAGPAGLAGEPWLGAMIPKRWAKRAVTRNTIKRQIYTVACDFESDLRGGAWVVRLRAGFDKTQFRSASSTRLKEAVRTELRELLARATRVHASKPLQGLAK
jgi:ribonuclease P protein component